MKFFDSASLPNAPETLEGVKFISEDGQWRVCLADTSGSEWVIWQRLRRPDPIADPRGWGYVRRAEWAVFTHREQAMVIASLLSAMPATLSGRVVEAAVSDAMRSAATRLLFVGISSVITVIKKARAAAEAARG